jgi:hypothetical protein
MKTKTTKTVSADVKHARSMAAYKAHITRHTNLIEAAKRQITLDSQAAIKQITANMQAA